MLFGFFFGFFSLEKWVFFPLEKKREKKGVGNLEKYPPRYLCVVPNLINKERNRLDIRRCARCYDFLLFCLIKTKQKKLGEKNRNKKSNKDRKRGRRCCLTRYMCIEVVWGG
eukprot:UN01935